MVMRNSVLFNIIGLEDFMNEKAALPLKACKPKTTA